MKIVSLVVWMFGCMCPLCAQVFDEEKYVRQDYIGYIQKNQDVSFVYDKNKDKILIRRIFKLNSLTVTQALYRIVDVMQQYELDTTIYCPRINEKTGLYSDELYESELSDFDKIGVFSQGTNLIDNLHSRVKWSSGGKIEEAKTDNRITGLFYTLIHKLKNDELEVVIKLDSYIESAWWSGCLEGKCYLGKHEFVAGGNIKNMAATYPEGRYNFNGKYMTDFAFNYFEDGYVYKVHACFSDYNVQARCFMVLHKYCVKFLNDIENKLNLKSEFQL